MNHQEQIDQLKAELDATRAEASKYCEAWESAEYMRKSTFEENARLTRELAELTEYTDIVKRTLFALIDRRDSSN